MAALARSAAFYSSVAGLVHPLNWWLHVKSCDPSARQGRISRAHDPTPGSREPSNARNSRLDNRSTYIGDRSTSRRSATKEQDAAFLDKCAVSLLHILNTDANGTAFIEIDDDLHGREREDGKGGKCDERTVACSQIV